MRFRKYDIVLIDFPFSDLKDSKIRPAIVVLPLEGENTILCQITTKRRGIDKYEVNLNKESCKGDIRFDSNINLDMIFTLHESLVINRVGFVNNVKVRKEINIKLKGMFS